MYKKTLLFLVMLLSVSFAKVDAQEFDLVKKNVSLDKVWTVTFNTEVYTQYDSIYIVAESGEKLEVEDLIIKSDIGGDKTVTIKNPLPYKPNTDYVLHVTNIESVEGERMGGDFLLKFTTKSSEVNVTNVELSGVDDLEDYLNKEYSVLYTPAGNWSFTHEISENDNKIFYYDYQIKTDWDPMVGLAPYTLENSIKITEEEKRETEALLTQFQKEIANLAIKTLPDKKITGGFYSGHYKYPYSQVGYSSTKFNSWINYDRPGLGGGSLPTYHDAELSKFQWFNGHDDYNFMKDNPKSVSIPEWNESQRDQVQSKEWDQTAEETNGSNWEDLSEDQKVKLVNEVLKEWEEDGNTTTKSVQWFLGEIEEEYEGVISDSFSVVTVMDMIADVNLIFDE